MRAAAGTMEPPFVSPPPPTTLRRNPPRRARPPPTPLPSSKPKPAPAPAPAPALSRLLDEAADTDTISPDPDRLKVFLRIRPLPDPKPAAKDHPRKPKPAGGGGGGGGGVCLVATGANSVALTVPHSRLLDPKRARTEVFDGFSSVFSPGCSQHDVFAQVMEPVVDEFLGGKSGLLVAMGPTGSGKTHTLFGSPRNPGVVPLTLHKIFAPAHHTRPFCLSMFEILSEGKGERILDLLSDAADLVLQQSTIKGLKEVTVSNVKDAESLVSCGMLKRSTAATKANSKSSRSQCIITIRAVCRNINVESECLTGSALLTIADLAGAERERRTGNQGSRLLESNFINNTSMVFGLCLRSLLEHQKNQKKPLEKHFKNSMLTRYLRDYLEGKKKMTLILNVKSGDDDYLDTSFLLRQASPYMKIKYNSLEDSTDLVSQKRSNVSLICQENKKRRKVHKPEALVVEGKDNIDKDVNPKVSERDDTQLKLLSSELRRVTRSEEITKNFARALWTVLKQYKQKLLESENGAESLRKLLRDKDMQIMDLKKELKILNSCSSDKFLIPEDTIVEQNDVVSSGPTEQNDALAAEEASEDFTCCGPARPSTNCDMKAGSDNCSTVTTIIDEQEWSSNDLKLETFGPKCCAVKKEIAEVDVQVDDDELDKSKRQTSAHDIGVTHTLSHSDQPSDQSLTEQHVPKCIKSERVSLSPQFAGCGKIAPIVQSEEQAEESSNTTEESIQHDADIRDDIRELKHHDSISSSQQINLSTQDINSSQSSLQMAGMGAVLQNPQEVDSRYERFEPTVEKTIVEYGHGQSPNILNDLGGMFPCLPNGRTSPTKDSIVQSKDCVEEEIADKKDISVSRPCNTKKNRRRLLPIAGMLLKEFSGPDMEVDVKKEERVKCGEADVRSHKLIQLLKKA